MHLSLDIDMLYQKGFFSDLDYHFAAYMSGIYNENDPVVTMSCALVSKALSEGHVCLDISRAAGGDRPVSESGEDRVRFPLQKDWISALERSAMVSGTARTPLVLDRKNRLFMAKYYDAQERLSHNIAKRVQQKSAPDYEKSVNQVAEPFFDPETDHSIAQKNAVNSAAGQYFTIVSGGPGTGKTHVTRVICQVFEALSKKLSLPEPKIVSVAPTGKAASKLENGRTIHSVLKPRRGGQGFYHTKENPIQADLLIIDEASMIDILLLTRLLEAVPLSCRIVLLGDRHQLSSVQAGSVFSDICSARALAPRLFLLTYNFRSKGKTGIENLSRAVNLNDADQVEEILVSGQFPDVTFIPYRQGLSLKETIAGEIMDGYHPFLAADTVASSLDCLDLFKILCAHNLGEYGTLQINHLCEKILRCNKNFDIQDRFFKQIVMVTANDYKKELFNGDTGIVMQHNGKPTVFFRGSDSRVKHFRYQDLPDHTPAFAITIHKSQGSEFNTVLVAVPDRLSPVVTRQLLYTGVTRAKDRIIVAGDLKLIKAALNLTIKRDSGLTDRLDDQLNADERQH